MEVENIRHAISKVEHDIQKMDTKCDREEVKEMIKKEMTTNKATATETVKEQEERDAKQNNIIIHNLDECVGGLKTEKKNTTGIFLLNWLPSAKLNYIQTTTWSK